jgi:hypothetical protein
MGLIDGDEVEKINDAPFNLEVWMARGAGIWRGGIPCHFYLEIEMIGVETSNRGLTASCNILTGTIVACFIFGLVCLGFLGLWQACHESGEG